MKKLIVLFLTIILTLSICGCASDEDIRGEITTNPTQPTNATEPTEPEYAMGTAASNTYTSAFLGLSCALPGDWRFYSDEEILQMNNINSTYMDEAAQEVLRNATIIYDMAAINEANYSNININLEKLTPLQAAALNLKAALEAQSPTIKTAFSNMGYTDTDVKYAKVTVDGKEFDALEICAKINGVDFYEIVFSFQKGLYMVNVTVACTGTDQIAQLLDYFTVS